MSVSRNETVLAPDRRHPARPPGAPGRRAARDARDAPGYRIGPADRGFLSRVSTNLPTTGFFLDFDGPPPGPEELAARTLLRARSLPALHALHPDPDRRRWTAGGDALDPAVHFHHRPALTGQRGLDAATGQLLHQQLPDAPHPRWDVWLLTPAETPAGDTSGTFRICFRIHHAVQDGVGAAYSVLALLADTATEGPRLHPARRPTVAGMLSAGRDVLRSLRPEGKWPGLQAESTGRSSWTYQDVAASHLRSLADAHGASVNDVCLAALAVALRSWRDEQPAHPRPCPDLPVLIPMSTRQPHERHTPGNRVAAHRLLLPCSEEGFGEAVGRVNRQTAAVRDTRRRDAARAALARPLVPRLADWTVRTMGNRRSVPLGASSVTFPQAFSCFGARLTAASMFYNMQENVPTYLSLTRTPDTVRCALMYDAALARTATIPGHWKQALEEA
ncbi:wax ester/triacylglycerol synthase domain-containing protein [Streptomyces sp. NPDC053048]|uniref:wax ester/triacylglycerol synthase domain-containing protein n=1 Tax=Streptomyces sp. NPDC053048 TaxID=3365694 RepID=UPI0037D4EE95